jgi:dCMP deaminase
VSRPDWDSYFIGIARAVALRSDCLRAQVGAVIVDHRRRIVSTGYVGTFPGTPGCLAGACPRGKMSYQECQPGTAYDNCISFHAEKNAILYSDRSRHEGGTIYVTREPCNWCGKLIAASGIVRSVFATDGVIWVAELKDGQWLATC